VVDPTALARNAINLYEPVRFLLSIGSTTASD